MFGGKVFIESDYHNLIFAKNGEFYTIDNKKVLVIGGAYSIDKEYRLI
jgi:3-oxoacid CoA-transferase subunit A